MLHGRTCRRVDKTVYDGPVFVVIAGLEGTGHHALCSLLANDAHGVITHSDSTLQHAVASLIYATPDDLHNASDAVLARLQQLRTTLPASSRFIMQCPPLCG